MLCRKCNREIPDNSTYCNFCGIKQSVKRQAKKVRGNSQGSVYKNKLGKWTAEVTLGYDVKTLPDGTPHMYRKKKTKSNFATKKEALDYLPHLKNEITPQDFNIKFKGLYEKWLEIHSEKVSPSTINCYKSAYKYYSSLYYLEIAKIRTEHLQKCIDTCSKGRRTKENMKALGTCLWRYAMQLDIVDRNYAEYIYIKKEEKQERLAFLPEQLDLMWDKVNDVPELKYVLILCYTGMRLNEMLSAKTENYNAKQQFFVTGSKTEAGKDRIITISPRILPFFNDLGKGTYLFFNGDKKPTERKFRNDMFYKPLEQIGIDDGSHPFTPHCCRHTFATLMKNVNAPATDKQKLIGHSKFEMTAHYTHTDIDSLKKITDNI